MNIQTLFTFASAYALGVWCSAGLRLRAYWGLARSFVVVLASGSYPIWASSSVFRSVRPVLARPFSCAGSNPAVKRIRLRRPAYLVR
jgi:hypothetical protein